ASFFHGNPHSRPAHKLSTGVRHVLVPIPNSRSVGCPPRGRPHIAKDQIDPSDRSDKAKGASARHRPYAENKTDEEFASVRRCASPPPAVWHSHRLCCQPCSRLAGDNSWLVRRNNSLKRVI